MVCRANGMLDVQASAKDCRAITRCMVINSRAAKGHTTFGASICAGGETVALSPLIIQNFATNEQIADVLPRISLDKPPYNEDWLQNLIHENPELVPAGEIEAAFEDIIPVVRELPLPSGFLDNLYITSSGYPVLVEVKLWKNQEARRKVVAQILEYAKDFAHLNYEDLNTEIRKLRKSEKWGDNPLYEIACRAAPNTLEQSVFVDRVSRNMREGRFLLLIVGDGVREDMANLANYLLMHSLRYAFGIVQIKLFTLPDGALLAQPDILAKTQMIERHVTVVSSSNAHIQLTEAPYPPIPQKVVSERLEKTSLSLEDFFETLAKTAPNEVFWLREFLQSLSDLSIDLQVGKNGDSLMLKSPTDITLMYINSKSVGFWGLTERFKKSPEGMEVSKRILQRFADIVSGVIKVFPAGGMDIRVNDKAVPLYALHGKERVLKEALCYAVQEIELLDSAA